MSTLVKTSGVCESDRDRLRGLPSERFGQAMHRGTSVDTGEETYRELLWPVTHRHEVRQLSTLGGRGITIDRIHLSLDKLLTQPCRPCAERSAENTQK